jgi:chlorobactene glucosyltransferase
MPLLPLLLSLPWLAVPLLTLARARHSRTLNAEHAEAGDDAPMVSIVIPARNEAHNIVRCVESALASRWPRLDVIVVDDHSTDGTGDLVRAIAERDGRLRVITPDPLPSGWFGKQWACAAGAALARGEILAFLDADTWQAPDLVPRAVNAMRARGSDLLTVAGTQEMDTLWEKLLQPQVFAILLARYGGTELVNASRSAADKIANGQCMFFRRDAYDAMGGHGAVRDKVAEDLAMAQRFFLHGRRTTIVLGLDQLRTRMYRSLGELVAGWGKNIYAGGVDAMRFGAAGRALFPFLLPLPALSGLVPPVLLALSLTGVLGHGWLVWSAIVTSLNLLWWLAVYIALGLSPLYAFLHPFGATVLLYISLASIRRGRSVEWKGRSYVAG